MSATASLRGPGRRHWGALYGSRRLRVSDAVALGVGQGQVSQVSTARLWQASKQHSRHRDRRADPQQQAPSFSVSCAAVTCMYAQWHTRPAIVAMAQPARLLCMLGAPQPSPSRCVWRHTSSSRATPSRSNSQSSSPAKRVRSSQLRLLACRNRLVQVPGRHSR